MLHIVNLHFNPNHEIVSDPCSTKIREYLLLFAVHGADFSSSPTLFVWWFFSNFNNRILKHIKHTINNKHAQYSVNWNQFNFLKFIKLLNNLILVEHDPSSTLPLFQYYLFVNFNQCQTWIEFGNAMKLNQRALIIYPITIVVLWIFHVRGEFSWWNISLPK